MNEIPNNVDYEPQNLISEQALFFHVVKTHYDENYELATKELGYNITCPPPVNYQLKLLSKYFPQDRFV